MSDVLLDRGREECGLLGDQADLRAEPLDVKILEVVAIELHNTLSRIVEPFDQAHNGGFARARCANESCGFAGLELDGKSFDDLNAGTGWIVELDIFESNAAFNLGRA